jgi:hypothetical protein
MKPAELAEIGENDQERETELVRQRAGSLGAAKKESLE